MNKVLYFEVLVICFILLCHVLISVNKKNSDDNVLLSLKRLIVAVLVMLVFNFICEYVQGDNNPFIMSLSEILFLTGSCFVSYLGYLHIKFIVNEKSKNIKIAEVASILSLCLNCSFASSISLSISSR